MSNLDDEKTWTATDTKQAATVPAVESDEGHPEMCEVLPEVSNPIKSGSRLHLVFGYNIHTVNDYETEYFTFTTQPCFKACKTTGEAKRTVFTIQENDSAVHLQRIQYAAHRDRP